MHLWSGRKKVTILVCLLTVILATFAGFFYQHNAFAQNPMLYWGSSGDYVYALQNRLRDWGYYDGPIDGYFGTPTSKAVQKFQYLNGLPEDGVVDRTTWDALGYAQPARGGNYTGSSRGDSNRDVVDLLARVIMGEAADEPYLGKVAVGAVIVNRTRHSGFPDSVPGVIYQPDAFESVMNGEYNQSPSDAALKAAQDALNGYDPTGGAIYFWNPAKPVSGWIWSRPVIDTIGHQVFAL